MLKATDTLESAQTCLSGIKRELRERYLAGDLVPFRRQPGTIPARPPLASAPLSFEQEPLWLLSQIPNLPPLHNEVITLRRSGPLDLPTLERVLAEIVRRHEIWRTTYDLVDGGPVQIVLPASVSFPLSSVDLRGVDKSRCEQQALRIVRADAQRPFDLRRGPLLRATLLRMADSEYRLVLVAHLSIVDGVSVYQVFPYELTVLYSAFSAGKPSPLPDLPLQYADYAYWQRKTFDHANWNEQLAYWRRQLAGDLPRLQWPLGYSRRTVQTHRGVIRQFLLSRSLADELKQSARLGRVTLFTMLVTSFASLLHCYTRQVDLVIGTPSPTGRKRMELQNSLGNFLNPVPLRINLDGDPTFRELEQQVHQVIAEALSHNDVPIEFVAKGLHTKSERNRNSVFTVAISLQPQTAQLPSDWRVTSMDVGSGGSVWDLYIAFIDTIEHFLGRVQYNPDVFKRAVVAQMLRDLKVTMKVIAAQPGQRLSSLQQVISKPD